MVGLLGWRDRPGMHDTSQRSDREKYLIACIEYQRDRALRAERRVAEVEAEAANLECAWTDAERRVREQAAELEMGVWPQ